MAQTEPGMWTCRALYADWEYDCCGSPFRVGDEVRWQLELHSLDAGARALWREHLSELHPLRLPALRRVAVLRAETSPPRGARLYGLPAVTNHYMAVEEVERLTARVRAIHVVSGVTRERAHRAAAPGELALVPVDDSTAGPPVWRRASYPGCQAEQGFLVTLEAAD